LGQRSGVARSVHLVARPSWGGQHAPHRAGLFVMTRA
jgi:hypothetical protein